MKKNLSKQYSSYQISLTKKSFNCFGMNRFTLEYQPNTFTTTQHKQEIVHMKSFPKIKHTSSIRHFHLKYSQLHKLWLSTVLISVSTIHITHRFNQCSLYIFILASTAVETSPNTSRIQLNFTGGSSVLDARISAIFFLQFLGRKLKVY